MNEARYLIRLTNRGSHQPEDQPSLLKTVRAAAIPHNGKVINLRVTPSALEFDLFCDASLALPPFVEAWAAIGFLISSKRLDLPPVALEAPEAVTEARSLFNEHRFWEVHEVLEGLWKKKTGSEKQLVQGLILAAAALVHAQKNEIPVIWPMLQDAMRRLEGQPAVYFGWDLLIFRKHFEAVLLRRKITPLRV